MNHNFNKSIAVDYEIDNNESINYICTKSFLFSDENIYEIETFFKNHINQMYCIQQMETHDKSRKL